MYKRQVVGVPFTSLVPVLAKDSTERTMVVSWKNVMIQVGRFFITTFAWPLVEVFGGGATGWGRFGALVGVLITLCLWCEMCIRDRVCRARLTRAAGQHGRCQNNEQHDTFLHNQYLLS